MSWSAPGQQCSAAAGLHSGHEPNSAHFPSTQAQLRQFASSQHSAPAGRGNTQKPFVQLLELLHSPEDSQGSPSFLGSVQVNCSLCGVEYRQRFSPHTKGNENPHASPSCALFTHWPLSP